MAQAVLILNQILLIAIPLVYAPFFQHSFTSAKYLSLLLIVAGALVFASLKILKSPTIKVESLKKNQIFIVASLIFALLGFYTFFSQTPIISLFGTMERKLGLICYSILFIVFVLNSLFLEKKHFQKILTVIQKTGFVISIYAIMQYLGYDPLFSSFNSNIFHDRSFSFLGNPSFLGQILCLTSIVNLQQVKSHPNSKLAWLNFFIQLLALILSGTRSSLLAFLIGSCFLFKKQFKKILIILSICLFIFAGSQAKQFTNSDSINSRISIWQSTIQLVKEKPFGYGIENIQAFFPKVQQASFNYHEDNPYKTVDKVHNQTLSILYSTGPLGLILYAYIIFLLIKILFKSPDSTHKLISLVILTNLIQNQLNFFDLPTLLIITILASFLKQSQVKQTLQVSKVYTVVALILSLSIFNFTIKQAHAEINYKSYNQNFHNDYQAAQKHLDRSLQQTPYYAKLWVELGYSNLEQRLRTYVGLKKLENSSPQSKIWIAKYLEPSYPKISENIFQQLHKLNPQNPVWLFELTSFYQRQNQTQNFLNSKNTILNLFPEIQDAQTHKAKTFIQNMPEYHNFFPTTH